MLSIESLEARTFLSASPTPAVDEAAIHARLEQLRAVRASLDAGQQTLVEKRAAFRTEVRDLLTSAKAQAKLDRAAIKAARGSAADQAVARADAKAHRTAFREQLAALRVTLRDEIAAARESVGSDRSTLRQGIKAFSGNWTAEWRQALEDAKDKPEVKKLFADAKAIAADSDVTQEDLANLADAFDDVLTTAQPPSEQTVDGLIESVRTAFADDALTDAERTTLTDGARAVLRSANVSDAAIDQLTAAVESIFDKANVSDADVETIAGDVRAVLNVLGTIFG